MSGEEGRRGVSAPGGQVMIEGQKVAPSRHEDARSRDRTGTAFTPERPTSKGAVHRAPPLDAEERLSLSSDMLPPHKTRSPSDESAQR